MKVFTCRKQISTIVVISDRTPVALGLHAPVLPEAVCFAANQNVRFHVFSNAGVELGATSHRGQINLYTQSAGFCFL